MKELNASERLAAKKLMREWARKTLKNKPESLKETLKLIDDTL